MSIKKTTDIIAKNFKLADVIKHKDIAYKNLYEILSLYPNKGVGFKIWRKTWKNKYYLVDRVEFKDASHGTVIA